MLEGNSGSDLHFEPAVIFDPETNITLTSYREIGVRQEVAPEAFAKPETLSGNAWLCGNSLVVSGQVRDAIIASAITGVRFSPTFLLLPLG